MGVNPGRVFASGIPIDPAFGSFGDRAGLRREMGFSPERPVVLVCGGGLGLGGIEETVRALLERRSEIDVVVVCGRNPELRARLEPLQRAPARGAASCRVLGFTVRMAELMGAADLMIGKPGGLTTAEAAASGLPMVLLRPIPGQEERNAASLVDCGAAVLEADPSVAGDAAVEILSDQDRLESMRRAARGAGRLSSAAVAAACVLELIGMRPVAAG
jgi:processive 1,2-diacylglycerol beta-glucosyltransferase